MTDNNNHISDDQLSQFLAFTGTSDPNVARQYLEMSGNQLEMAVSLFMDHNHTTTTTSTTTATTNSGGGAMMGGGSPEVRAPDATRSMRLVGGPPSPILGGNSNRTSNPSHNDDAAAAALMAAVGGPNAAQQMMMMGMMGGGDTNHNGRMMMEDVMANTWANNSNDLRETVNRAAAAADYHNRRRRTGSRSSSSSVRNNYNDGNRTNNNGSDDDDEVQEVDSNGNIINNNQDMEESYHNDDDDEDSYHYNDQSDDDSMGGTAALPSSSSNNTNNNNNRPPPSLSTMFQPPNHLIHRAGGFLGAKNFAKDARRWLLVNIQSEDDFACHALNRDVWHDELVENLVREGFVFWQISSSHPEGMTYCTRYKVEGRYPHIAILDPRTGSLLYRKEGWTQVNPLTAEQFVEIASDFCSRHSFDRLPMPARHGYAAVSGGGGGGGSGEVGSGRLPAKRPVHELSEQEQLEAAIRASMEDAGGGQAASDDDDVQVLEEEENDGGGGVIGKSIEEEEEEENSAQENNHHNKKQEEEDSEKQEKAKEDSKLSPFEAEILSMTVPDEPTTTSSSGPNIIAKVQLRMPNGKRLVRKFDGNLPVKVIYAFVAQLDSNIEDAKAGRQLDAKAKFPPVDLMPFVEESISSQQLSGEAITFLWK